MSLLIITYHYLSCCNFRFEDRKFHLHNIAKTPSADARSKRLMSLNNFASYLVDKVNCQQKLIANYFETSCEKCGRCGNCLNSITLVTVDNTLHARQLITCLQNMQLLKEKVSIDALSGTYIGSKGAVVKSQKFDQVPSYGKGKGCFKSVSHLTGFIYYLIINGIFVENLRDEQDKVKSTFVSLGNVRELLSRNVTVLY